MNTCVLIVEQPTMQAVETCDYSYVVLRKNKFALNQFLLNDTSTITEQFRLDLLYFLTKGGQRKNKNPLTCVIICS